MGITKEHIPPKAFFPRDQRNQLLTVKSCSQHNSGKSEDDLYILAHVCLNVSPANGARDLFERSVGPQLSFNDNALRKLLIRDMEWRENGTAKYRVDLSRFNRFFDALCYGLIFKKCNSTLPEFYSLKHIYHNFESNSPSTLKKLEEHISKNYDCEPTEALNFGRIGVRNSTIYSVKIFGTPNFQSSITIVHLFFGQFRVTSMLTKQNV